MGAIYIVIGALGALALVLMRWLPEEYETHGHLSDNAALAFYALFVMHGLSTLLAAVGEVWLVDVPQAPAIAVGAAIAAAGAVLLGSGVRALGMYKRVTGQLSDRLETGGAYARSRHPQYTGWTVFLIGAAIAGRSGLALLLAVGWVVVLVRYAEIEERHLHSTFGERFASWRAVTPAVLGGRSAD